MSFDPSFSGFVVNEKTESKRSKSFLKDSLERSLFYSAYSFAIGRLGIATFDDSAGGWSDYSRSNSTLYSEHDSCSFVIEQRKKFGEWRMRGPVILLEYDVARYQSSCRCRCHSNAGLCHLLGQNDQPRKCWSFQRVSLSYSGESRAYCFNSTMASCVSSSHHRTSKMTATFDQIYPSISPSWLNNPCGMRTRLMYPALRKRGRLFSDRFLEKTYLVEDRNHMINNDYFVSSSRPCEEQLMHRSPIARNSTKKNWKVFKRGCKENSAT